MDKNGLLIELSESDKTDFGRVAFEDQPEPQRVFTAIWVLESQVNNGGFWQYFQCVDGHTANFAPAALRLIGATNCADLVARALQVVSARPLPEDQGVRTQIVDGLDENAVEALDELDQQFFTYPDDLTELLFAYVRSRPKVFGKMGAE